MAEGYDRYTGAGNDVEHEAGYDAYMTGVIYLAFIAFIRERQQENPENGDGHLKRKRSESEANDESEEESEQESEDDEKIVEDGDDEDKEDNIDEKSANESESESEDGEASSDEEDKPTSIFMDKSIVPYYGRIFLMRSDIPYIDLKGDEQVGKFMTFSLKDILTNKLLELITYPNKFYLHNIPAGFTNAAIEKVYPSILPIAVSWVNDNNAWIILRDESKIPQVKLGMLGLSTVQSFLPGCSRQVEGEAYGITKEAGKMELISHEQWRVLFGPKKTVSYDNTAEALMAANINSTSESSSSTTEVTVPTGGAGYDGKYITD